MSQSRSMSLIEATTNVFVGYVMAVAGQVVVFPVVGLDATFRQSLQIGALFTGLSLVRGYVLRRLFERAGSRGFSCRKHGA